MRNQGPVLRCAIYARYSSLNQRDASIEDQVRICREHAHGEGWVVLEQHLYLEPAISGAGSDRPALSRLLEHAQSGNAPFDVILVDDTSRLSRTQYEQMRMATELKFFGVRLVAVSQGIDSDDEQADVMFTVHGLVDSLYLKELAKKTHRGLEGLALKGLHTGGRVFGYDSVANGDSSKQLVINPEQAKIVQRIFKMYASGLSLKKVAKVLNSERVPSPRPGTRKKYDTWCPTAIREMLRRELYVGVIVWNKRKFIKRPGTNKRLSRPRSQAEWKVFERPELRIISDETWDAVQKRIAYTTALYSEGAKKGLANRAQSSAYLLSGYLKCSNCGSNLVIISGRGNKYARYGCSQHWNRGACDNDLTIHREVVERVFFDELQTAAEQPEAIKFVIEELARQLKQARDGNSDDFQNLIGRKQRLETELERLATAIAQGASVSTVKKALKERERELQEIHKQLQAAKPDSLDKQIEELRRFTIQQIFDIVALFRRKADNAKYEFAKHCGEIWMTPLKNAEGERFYVGIGHWNLEGFLGGGVAPSLCRKTVQEFLSNSYLVYQSPIVPGVIEAASERNRTHFDGTMNNCKDSDELQKSDFIQCLSNRNATGALLNCGVRSVAGAGFEPATFGL